jgi:hypothetical protein
MKRAITYNINIKKPTKTGGKKEGERWRRGMTPACLTL